jgi:hypothetical protein
MSEIEKWATDIGDRESENYPYNRGDIIDACDLMAHRILEYARSKAYETSLGETGICETVVNLSDLEALFEEKK